MLQPRILQPPSKWLEKTTCTSVTGGGGGGCGGGGLMRKESRPSMWVRPASPVLSRQECSGSGPKLIALQPAVLAHSAQQASGVVTLLRGGDMSSFLKSWARPGASDELR